MSTSATHRWVLDSSAALHVVMRQTGSVPLIDTLAGADRVFVPHLYFSECANALWKYVNHALLNSEQAIGRLEELVDLPDEVIDDQPLVIEALSLATLHRYPVHDLMYIVLARRYACGLLTKDKRLAALASDLGVVVFPTL